ncbi:MAG: class I SAM-dependent methyltransferase, partial [Candidatus Helarchaeota archaeon]|nr:class I SAM-dependent methyltransferase [Candidatus Helarchaeota archaeon]
MAKIIRHYYHFPIPSVLTRIIDNPIRRKFIQRPKDVVERMQLKPGMIVVEIGPGKGNYTKAVANNILPDGKVFACDIQESVIERLKKLIEKEGIPNIIPK